MKEPVLLTVLKLEGEDKSWQKCLAPKESFLGCCSKLATGDSGTGLFLPRRPAQVPPLAGAAMAGRKAGEAHGLRNPRWDMGWVDSGRAGGQANKQANKIPFTIPQAGSADTQRLTQCQPVPQSSAIPRLYDDARPRPKRGGAGGRRRLAGLLVSFATVNSVSSSPVRWDPIKRPPALSLLFGSY
jgi:hypothetical protein